MSHFKPKTIVAGAAIVPLAALVIAGCGGGSNDQKGTSVPAPSPPPTAANARATVTIASTSLGKILVDAQGRSLYLFAGDQQPGQVNGQGSTAFGAPWLALSASGKQIAN